jgi:hypothetical protein
MTKSDKMQKDGEGYKCECGLEHVYPAYVHAHWEIEITHTCFCGRKYIIQYGFADLVKGSVPSKKVKEK